MTNELKPCPFCGGEAIINTMEPHKHLMSGIPDYGGGTFIECTTCTCAIAEKTEDEAIEAWNRRTSEWMPCSERLPEFPTGVMVTLKNGSVMEAYFSKKNGFIRIDNRGDWIHLAMLSNPPIAWMPLPEPYKEGE